MVETNFTEINTYTYNDFLRIYIIQSWAIAYSEYFRYYQGMPEIFLKAEYYLVIQNETYPNENFSITVNNDRIDSYQIKSGIQGVIFYSIPNTFLPSFSITGTSLRNIYFSQDKEEYSYTIYEALPIDFARVIINIGYPRAATIDIVYVVDDHYPHRIPFSQ